MAGHLAKARATGDKRSDLRRRYQAPYGVHLVLDLPPVTEALNVFSGDYRKVRAFSRHSSLDIVRRYDDNRADHGGQVAAALSAIVG